MDNITKYELYKAMDKELGRQIDIVNSDIEKNEKAKVKSWIDRVFTQSSTKKLEKELKMLTELRQSLYDLNYDISSSHKMPRKLEECFDKLGVLLTNDEVEHLKNLISGSIRKNNSDGKKDIARQISELKKILKKLKLSNTYISVNHLNDIHKSRITLDSALEMFRAKKMKQFNDIDLSAKIAFNSNDEISLETIRKMIKNNEIENIYSLKSKLDRLLETISIAILELEKVHEVDFSNVRNFLKMLEGKYRKQISMVSGFIANIEQEKLRTRLANNQVLNSDRQPPTQEQIAALNELKESFTGDSVDNSENNLHL